MKHIQSRLFISYSALIVVLFSLLLGTYYFSIRANLRESRKADILNYSNSIGETFDQQISLMNNASVKLVFSTDFKHNFYQNLTLPNDTSTVLAKRDINDIIYTISGPTLPYDEINIINTTNGKYFCTGQYTNYQILPVSYIFEIPGVTKCLESGGKRVIMGPHADPFRHFDEDVFSVSRSFSEKYSTEKNSVIIVQQKYAALSSSLDTLSGGNKYFIFDENGELFNTTTEYAAEFEGFYSEFRDSLPNSHSVDAKIINNTNYVIAVTYSKNSDLYTMVVADESAIASPFTNISIRTLIIGIILIIIALIISFLIARALTMPINKIRRTIESVQLSENNRISYGDGKGQNVTEMEWLDNSISEMASKLDTALADILTLKSYEAEARLRAFQMQMGPHFLYNTLSIIGIHAQNGEKEIAKQMCDDLCSMLRYIGGSGEKSMSSIEEELENTEKYISLMQNRYPGNINYDINVEAQLLDYQLPRLTIQPIVENCIKYGISTDGKWRIHVTGQRLEDSWVLSISDEGQGFGNSSEVPVVSTMVGLKNIKERLELTWPDRVTFSTDNLPTGGAVVTIKVLIT